MAPADVGAKIVSCSAALGVVMTHSFQNDREALAILLTSKATYIGVLGPARRCARLLSEIDPSVRTPAVLRRVHGPAGLHLGGSSPAEVALSIVLWLHFGAIAFSGFIRGFNARRASLAAAVGLLVVLLSLALVLVPGVTFHGHL